MRALCLIVILVWPGILVAQEFPNRPIKFIVPFPAGGPADTISRIVTEKMSSILGQPIVVETRAGAGGMIGIASVAKSDPDGYTIAIAPSSQLAMNVNLRDDMPFHPLKDLALITQIVSVPEILVVNEKVPAKTLAELVALAKAEPGKLVYASTGHGGMPHMAMELFRLTAGIQLVHTPYTGAAPAVNDLLGGHVQMMFADVPVLLGNIQAGKLRALAIGSRDAHRQSAVGRNDGGARHAAGRGRQLVRARRAGRDAAAGAGEAAVGSGRGAAFPRGEGQARRPERDCGRQFLRGVLGLRQKRDRSLGQGHRRSGHQAQIGAERRAHCDVGFTTTNGLLQCAAADPGERPGAGVHKRRYQSR